jgi:hypothetical protein
VTASHRWVRTSILGLAAVLASTPGRAARAEVLILDACMEKCSEADWLAIGNIRHVLESEIDNNAIVASVDGVIDRLGSRVPFPGIQDPTLTVELLTKHLQDGINLWTAGDHEAAAASLRASLVEATMNPAIVAADPTLRPLVQRAYVARAVSLYRLKHIKDAKTEARDPRVIEAKDAIADLVRMIPQASIQDTWGTGPDKVFQMSRNDLVARGMGSLSIYINDPTAVFYLNAAGQPHTGAFTAEVFPGVYQVFVADAAQRSRRYRIEVLPHQHTILNIDWRRDTRFEVATSKPTGSERPSRIGLTFASFTERRRETDYASDIATQVPGSIVAVVGRIKWEGKEALAGVMYAPEQPAFRVGVVLGNDLRSARDLAFYLMTDKPAPRVIQLSAPPWEGAPVVQNEGSLSRSPRWIIISGSVALAAGVTLYAINRKPDRSTAPYGIGLGAAGLVAVGLGFWFARAVQGPVVSMSPSHALIGWAGAF